MLAKELKLEELKRKDTTYCNWSVSDTLPSCVIWLAPPPSLRYSRQLFDCSCWDCHSLHYWQKKTDQNKPLANHRILNTLNIIKSFASCGSTFQSSMKSFYFSKCFSTQKVWHSGPASCLPQMHDLHLISMQQSLGWDWWSSIQYLVNITLYKFDHNT